MSYDTGKINCPVAMIIFNRYDNAKKVFEQIKKVQPPKLYVIADGPRTNRVGEEKLCQETRNIINEVNWPCQVITHFSDVNMGCQQRIATGLTWLFEQEEYSIILEDDCVPSKSFFFYCEEMLEKYKNDERIMVVSGDNKSFASNSISESYYFTRHVHIWGWATWARAWKHFDLKVSNFPKVDTQKMLKAFCSKKSFLYYWSALFNAYYKGRVASWDGAWVFAVWAQSGLSIAPKKNLVQNIGFSKDATHTTGNSIYSTLQAEELDFPLTHPEIVIENRVLDDKEMKMRLKDEKRLPYPLCKWASQLKWYIKEHGTK
jgi:hypothetical protein